MPILKFHLQKPRLVLDVEPSQEEWELIFDARIQHIKDGDSFNILFRGKQYDAFTIGGTAYIRARANPGEQSSREIKRLRSEFGENAIGSIGVSYSSEQWEEIPPFFDITIALSPDSFRSLVERYVDAHIIALWITTPIAGNGLIYGNDPNGREIEWWVERSNSSVAESASLRLIGPSE
jgi:hypothetical protein